MVYDGPVGGNRRNVRKRVEQGMSTLQILWTLCLLGFLVTFHNLLQLPAFM